ncbi:MAG: alanine racemase [Acidimicrobiales bacterium]
MVKADGYGHGALTAARAALGAGASWLAVAHAAEGAALRRAGIDAPILLLSEPVDDDEVDAVVANGLRATVYSTQAIAALAARRTRLAVHLKVDTGMRRVGAAPGDVLDLVRALRSGPLELEGVCTHCAVADEPGNGFTAVQLERFADVLDALGRHGIEVPVRHAANSAALLTQPGAAYDLVRPGIALYGVAPGGRAGRCRGAPSGAALALTGQPREAGAGGEGISYGHHHRFAADSVVATVPVGYADGLPRRWGLRGGWC